MSMTTRLLKQPRNKNWNNPKEVHALLDLWEENLEQLQKVKRNWLIYHRMSTSMAKQGFRRSPLEMRKKVANLVMKWKSEKSKETGWQYLDRMETILRKCPPLPDTPKVQQPRRIESSNPVNRENDMQEILFITSDDTTNAADIEELLNSMEDEEETNKSMSTDENSRQSLSTTPNGDIPVDTTVESSSQVVNSVKQPDQADSENDDRSDSNNRIATISGETTSDRTLDKQTIDSGITNSILPMKLKTDDSKLLPRIEKTFSITIPKPIAPKAADGKDEINLYVDLLASRLRSMDEKTRYIAMNRIDNIMFKMKMDLYTDQHV